jgi:iron(III) transport system permease protein
MTLPMKATALPYQNIAFGVLPRPDRTSWLFIIAITVVVYLVVPPLLFILISSLMPPAEETLRIPTLANFTGIFDSFSDFKLLLWNSLIFSIGSSGLALVFGTTLAWLAERTNARFRGLTYVSAFVSFAIPGIIKVIGWILLFGPEAGYLNVAVKSLTGMFPLFNVFSMGGMILVEGFLWTPVVFLLMGTPFRSMDPSLEEAAVVSGSSEWQVFRRVTFPMAAPSVLSVLILTFVRSLEAFEIPALIGLPAGIEIFTTQIYTQLKGSIIPDYGHASAYSVILIALVSLVLIPYYRITQDTFKFTTVTGKGFNPRRKDLGKWRWLGGLLLLSLPLVQLLPMMALLWSSLTPFLQVPSVKALGQLSFANYALAFNDPKIVRSTANSLLVSITSASGAVAVAFVVAWIVARTRISLRWMLDRLTMVPLVFPGIVLGVAILQMYLILPLPVYGTVWIMVAAFVPQYLPYAMRCNHAGLLGIHKELEESATASGASWGQVVRNIIAPLMMPALFAAWIYIFLVTVRELSVSLLLYSPGSEVISVVMWELWQNGAVGTLSAYALTISAAMALLAVIFYRTSRRYGLNV